MRIEKISVINDATGELMSALGPIDGGKSQSVQIFGDSSKSAWLKAICFALSYTSSGSCFPSAFNRDEIATPSIQIEFNIGKNDEISDFLRTVTNHESGKFCVRRSHNCAARQSEYHLNESKVERIDVKKLFESCGFSHNYPFQYYVDDDEVTSVETSDAKNRLDWLKNCSGLNDYHQKRAKAERIVADADIELQQIDKMLAKSDVQIDIYASNENQKIYQKLLTRESELDHFKRLHYYNELMADVQKITANIQNQNALIAANKDDVIQNVQKTKEIRRGLKVEWDKMAKLKAELHQLNQVCDASITTKSTLENSIAQLRPLVELGSSSEMFTVRLKRMYNDEINERTAQKNAIDKQIDALDLKKQRIAQQLTALETQATRILLNCQQNKRLGTQFDSIEKRNKHLTAISRKTQMAITKETRNFEQLKPSIDVQVEQLNRLKATLAEQKQQLIQMHADDEVRSFHEQEQTVEQLQNTKCALMQQNDSLAEKNRKLKLNLDDVCDKLRSKVGDSIFEGYKSLEEFMKASGKEFDQRYFGRIIDLFKCDDPTTLKTLPNLMGEYLFYHIVDTPQTATKIIAGFNAADHCGEIYFFALNIVNLQTFPHTELISRLSFDAKFQKVFEKICSDVCKKTLSMGKDRNSSLDSSESGYVTGALTATCDTDDDDGIEVNLLELYVKQLDLSEQGSAIQYERSENSYRMEMNETSLEANQMGLEQRYETIGQIQEIQASISGLNQSIQSLESQIRLKQTQLQSIESRLNGLRAEQQRWANEMTPSLLVQAETEEFDRVQALILDEKSKIDELDKHIQELTRQRDHILNYVEQDLMSQYSSVGSQSNRHLKNVEELAQQEQRLREVELYSVRVNENLIKMRHQMDELKKIIDAKKQQIKDMEQAKKGFEEHQIVLFQQLQDLASHQRNQNATLNRFKEQRHDVIIDIENPDIPAMPINDINAGLSDTRKQIRTYQNTNTFDLDFLNAIKKERQDFACRRRELTETKYKISMVMKKIDSDIDSSIRRTFNEFDKKFGDIFKKFVPTGAGKMALIEEMIENKQQITGVNIVARFQRDDVSFDRLFGQERRVVALVFVISMQQLWPAPFYLFDGIDELVFRPYLEPLIGYLNELSNDSQIIATSNSEALLNGPNLMENRFRSTVVAGTPTARRITGEKEAV